MLSRRAFSTSHAAVFVFFQYVKLGLGLSKVERGSQRIVLYYADRGYRETVKAAQFSMGDLTGQWVRFTLTLYRSQVSVALPACGSDVCSCSREAMTRHVCVCAGASLHGL